jgi:CheY-like chemotaxis protein
MALINQPPRPGAANAIRSTSYVLIVDTDADRIAKAVRECSDVLPTQLLIARDGDDAVRMLTQFGPPAILIVALTLPGKDSLAVIEALRSVDEGAAIIAWADDRELREYAASRLANSRAKVLGTCASPAVLRRSLDALLRGRSGAAGDDRRVSPQRVPQSENWSDLAERAQKLLGVAGAAVYARVDGETQYRLSVVWSSDAPMPPIPDLLPSAVDKIIAGGPGHVWADLANEPGLASDTPAYHESMRSLAIVPIVRDGDIAGALCAFDLKPHALGQPELNRLGALAGGAAIADAVLSRALSVAPPPTSLPLERDVARWVIPRELARVRREQLSLSVILFAATPRAPQNVELSALVTPPSIGEALARAVRGNDLVVRWTDSAVLLVLTGVGGGVARRVAERVRTVVEMNAANRIAVSGAVTELRTIDSFEATVARAAERLRVAVQDGQPRIA